MDNLAPGTELRHIDGTPPTCDCCGYSGPGSFKELDGQSLCWRCQGAWEDDKRNEHIKRLHRLFNRLAGYEPYDPESFEGRLLELEEEVK